MNTPTTTINQQGEKIAAFVFEIAAGEWRDPDKCQAQAKVLCAGVIDAIITQMKGGLQA